MVDAVQAGRGVVDYPGLYPIDSGYVLGNTSGVTALPVPILISALPANPLISGTTGFTGGTANGIAWRNGSVIQAGPATTDASGNIVLPSSTSLTTPTVKSATSTNLAITAGSGGALVLGQNATTEGVRFWNNFFGSAVGFEMPSSGYFGWSSTTAPSGTVDTMLGRAGAANFQFGGGAVDTAPVAQTLSVQNVLAGGTSNVAGANFTIAGSQGKGTGVGGSIIFQVAPAGSTGTAVNALVTALTIAGDKTATFGGTTSFAPGNVQQAFVNSGGLVVNNALTLAGTFTVPGAAVAAIISTATFTSGAAASLGTLTNAPSAGNPTSWIKIIDNGITRYIPAW